MRHPTHVLVATSLALVIGAVASAQDRQLTIRVPNEIVTRIVGDLDDVTEALAALDALQLDIGRDVASIVHGSLGHLRRGAFGASQNRDFQAERTDRETRSLDLGAAGFLELKNIVGDITVTAGSGTTTSVEIVRSARST